MRRAAQGQFESGAYGGNAGKTIVDLRRRACVGRFVQNVAEDLGYEVCVTTDGRAFIEAYKSFKPTTIILDMIMPGMDGNEIVLWLAQRKCTARLIIVTGYMPVVHRWDADPRRMKLG